MKEKKEPKEEKENKPRIDVLRIIETIGLPILLKKIEGKSNAEKELISLLQDVKSVTLKLDIERL